MSEPKKYQILAFFPEEFCCARGGGHSGKPAHRSLWSHSGPQFFIDVLLPPR